MAGFSSSVAERDVLESSTLALLSVPETQCCAVIVVFNVSMSSLKCFIFNPRLLLGLVRLVVRVAHCSFGKNGDDSSLLCCLYATIIE